MKISEILQALEIPSNEIKTRFKNKQIKLDGEEIGNIELDINENFIMDFGEFLAEFLNKEELKRILKIKLYFGVNPNEMFGTNIKSIEYLNQFHCLTIAKNESYIIVKNN